MFLKFWGEKNIAPMSSVKSWDHISIAKQLGGREFSGIWHFLGFCLLSQRSSHDSLIPLKKFKSSLLRIAPDQ